MGGRGGGVGVPRREPPSCIHVSTPFLHMTCHQFHGTSLVGCIFTFHLSVKSHSDIHVDLLRIFNSISKVIQLYCKRLKYTHTNTFWKLLHWNIISVYRVLQLRCGWVHKIEPKGKYRSLYTAVIVVLLMQSVFSDLIQFDQDTNVKNHIDFKSNPFPFPSSLPSKEEILVSFFQSFMDY